MSKAQRGQKYGVFTLVELMVVMSIIALLTTLLLPALRQAKSQAHMITCSGNLRQWNQATFFYTNDNAGYFPPLYYSTTGHNSNSWFILTGMYIFPRLENSQTSWLAEASPLSGKASVAVCPAEKYANVKWQPSYGWHGYYDERNALTQKDQLSMRNVSKLRSPTECFMHADTDHESQYAAGKTSNEDFRICRNQEKLISIISMRHGGLGINISFCDGHLERKKWTGYNFPIVISTPNSSTYNLWVPY